MHFVQYRVLFQIVSVLLLARCYLTESGPSWTREHNLNNKFQLIIKDNHEGHNEGSFCRRSFDGRSGYCILAYQCLHVVREYRIHGTKIDVCTYRRTVPVICCPLAEKYVEKQRISAKKCQEYYSDLLTDINFNSLRSFSGKMCEKSIPMIVGGQLVEHFEDYPHMVALGWSSIDDEMKWGCGGTLISDQFVLTAAHCTTSSDKPPDIVHMGSKYLNYVERNDIKILIVILHPKYKSSSYYHDIALLKLTKRITFTPYIRPACIWQLSGLSSIPHLIATGWGRTEFLGPKSNELRKVKLNLIDQRKCKELYKRERRLAHGIIDEQFCAGHLSGGKDTCQGDSGGPIHAELPELNCVKFVVGITSFGKFCASPDSPGVYTKIYMYLDWIERIVYHV